MLIQVSVAVNELPGLHLENVVVTQTHAQFFRDDQAVGEAQVTESARAHSYYSSKEVQKTRQFWLFTVWLFTVPSALYSVKWCLIHSI